MTLKNSIYNLLVSFDLRPHYLNSKEISLGRCACLGNDVLKLLRTRDFPHSWSVINYQKLRMDGFIRAFNYKPSRFGFQFISRHIPRHDIQFCVSMQSNRIFLKKRFNPKYIFIDDFSELTDSKFELLRNGYIFFSGVGDLDPKFRASKRLENHGLIEQDKLTQIYDKFFEICFSRWPDTHIFFLHFPTKLDHRSLYKKRGQAIRDSVHLLNSKYPKVYTFDCPEKLVNFGDDTNPSLFPYHYSKSVYDWFATEIAQKICAIEG